MKNVVGNTRAIKYLEMEAESGNVSHAYLFHGPESVGKTTVAIEFARKQLCSNGSDHDCACHECQLINASSHPDLLILDGSVASIDEVREVSSQLELKPYQAKTKVAIITHVDSLSTPALNAFLKTLEEPTEKTMIILTAENKENVLPTIISRSRLVSFSSLTDKEVFGHLNQEAGVVRALATDITSVAGGRLGYALSLVEDSEAVRQILVEGQEFFRIYRSDSISDKVSFAGKIAAEKKDLSQRVANIVIYLRKLLNEGVAANQKAQELSRVVMAIDDLTEAARLIKANVSPKLALEAALFGSILR